MKTRPREASFSIRKERLLTDGLADVRITTNKTPGSFIRQGGSVWLKLLTN